MTRRSPAIVAPICALALAGGMVLTSCSSDEEAVNAAASEIELARYLPKDAELVQTVDVEQVRKELELPDDANAAPTDDGSLRPNSPSARLFGLTSRAFPIVIEAFLLKVKADGASPLDGTLIRAAAGADGSLSIVSTSEPFDDVAAKLETTGYSLKRDRYVAGPKTPEGAARVVADGGNGRVIFAGDEHGATDALDRIDREAGPGTAAEAVQAVNGPVRTALAAPRGSECVEALAAAQSATGDGGVLAFAISGDKPNPDRFDPKILRALDTGTPSVLVDAMLVPFNVIKPTGKATEPVDEVFSYSGIVNEQTGQRIYPPSTGRKKNSIIITHPQPFDAYDCP